MGLIYTHSVQFSCSLMSDSLWPHESQHARSPCPSPTPGVYSDSRPLSQWCHPTISSSVDPSSSLLQSFPASGSFQRSQSSHQVAKLLEFQLQHQSFQWIFRLISFRTNCCELLAVQGTLKSTWSGSPAEAVRDSGSLKVKWQETFLGQLEKADVCACKEYLEELPGDPP